MKGLSNDSEASVFVRAISGGYEADFSASHLLKGSSVVGLFRLSTATAVVNYWLVYVEVRFY